MQFHFLPTDLVQISIPAPQNSPACDILLRGSIAAATENTLSIVLRNPGKQSSDFFRTSTRCVVRKSTPFGVLEFDATGQLNHIEKNLILTVTLLAPPRNVQRRAACRIELRSEVRYCDLALASNDHHWKVAELCDVSLGGLSLAVENDELQIGQSLQIEFSLNETLFSVPAVLRRTEAQLDSNALLCGFEYLELDHKQQNRLAKAITQLQLKIISSRVKVDQSL
jgi:hypothetical protein